MRTHTFRALGLLAIFLLNLPAWATGKADDEAIKRALSRYWQAFSEMNFYEAADLIHPDDLAAVKNQLVPIFVAAGASNDPGVREICDAFFKGERIGARAEISAKRAYAGLNFIIAKARPEIFQKIKGSTIDIIEIRPGKPGEAFVRYRLALVDGDAEDEDILSKADGTWYLRVKEPVELTASKFRRLLAP
jgi:hypothetical protein